jgi:hypothetical protein
VTISSSTSKFSTSVVTTRGGIVDSDLQQRRRSVAQPFQAAVDRRQEIVGAILADLHVRVANDAEQVRADDLDARKQVAEIQADDVPEEHEGHRPGGARQRLEARQAVGDLHARELRAPLVPHDDGEVPAAVRDDRKRMARIERQRRQQREDLAPEVLGEVRAHGVRVVFGIDEADAVLLERGAQRSAPARRLIFHQPRRATPDGGELLGRGQPSADKSSAPARCFFSSVATRTM